MNFFFLFYPCEHYRTQSTRPPLLFKVDLTPRGAFGILIMASFGGRDHYKHMDTHKLWSKRIY